MATVVKVVKVAKVVTSGLVIVAKVVTSGYD